MIGIGGGSLPVVDVVLFHSRGSVEENAQAHFEATSGCHADGCAIRSTAQQARFAPAVGSSDRLVSSPGFLAAPVILEAPFSNAPSGQPLSRAPPFFG